MRLWKQRRTEPHREKERERRGGEGAGADGVAEGQRPEPEAEEEAELQSAPEPTAGETDAFPHRPYATSRENNQQMLALTNTLPRDFGFRFCTVAETLEDRDPVESEKETNREKWPVHEPV